MIAKQRKEGLSPIAIITLVVLVLYTVSLLFPVFWTIMTSFKHIDDYDYGAYDKYGQLITEGVMVKNQFGWPKKWTFDNFITAYKHFNIQVEIIYEGEAYKVGYGIFGQFMNSLKYAVGCGITTTFTSLIMGYATARFRYKFSNYIYMFVLVTMALPIVGAMPSEIAVATKLGIFGTFPGIWIMRATFLNTYFLIFYAQFRMIPYDYTEAAKIDGASQFTIMWRIIVPLASATISAVFVLNFIAYWNDFQIPKIYLENYPVAALGMYMFEYSTEADLAKPPIKLAGIWILATPIVIFYAIFNKKLTVNLSVGGIKG